MVAQIALRLPCIQLGPNNARAVGAPSTSTEIVQDTYRGIITVWTGTDNFDGWVQVVLFGSPLLTEQSWHDTWAKH